MEHNHLVVMAGGLGSRFWPVSTPEHPKQFVDITASGRSLIRMTVDQGCMSRRKHMGRDFRKLSGNRKKGIAGDSGWQYIVGTLYAKYGPMYSLCGLEDKN